MQTKTASAPKLANFIPVAEYLRVSHIEQHPSLEVQAARIRRYASQNGFVVVQTYVDAGKSGLVLHRRPGLQKLLQDVVSGAAAYKAILVDDLSRWGRFQDTDESAHYEFLCKRSGIPVHYCSESFTNDGTLSSSILKNLQRNIAAEYSRELSVKSFVGQKHLVELGFRVGGQAGYGFRRMVVSQHGQKHLLRSGQYKSLADDRVILIPGPPEEVKTVRDIFSMALTGKSLHEIVANLNERGIPHKGPVPFWKRYAVNNILTNRKYVGEYIWNCTSRRLHSPWTRNPPDKWVIRVGAFPQLIDCITFDRVQRILSRKKRRWSEGELLEKLIDLRAKEGYLSENLIARTPGMPSLATYHRRLGAFHEIYRMIGYVPRAGVFAKSDQRKGAQILRDKLVQKIAALFPRNICIVRLPGRRRPLLRLDNGLLISILVCSLRRTPSGDSEWITYTVPAERQNVTLVCFMNQRGTGFSRYYVLPRIGTKTSRLFMTRTGRLLKTGFRVQKLGDLYRAFQVFSSLESEDNRVGDPEACRSKPHNT